MTIMTAVCYGENPKAHLCPLDRAILLTLGGLKGFVKDRGVRARTARFLLGGAATIQATVGSLLRLERLGYTERAPLASNTHRMSDLAWRLK